MKTAVLLTLLLGTMPVRAADAPVLAFKQRANGEYVFDTGVLRGVLRAGGSSKGLTDVVHIPTGQRLDSSMGLLSHYRVFTVGKRYGAGAWDWESQATMAKDGSILVRWAAAEDRPFELSAKYTWVSPQAIEVETSVSARKELRQFEVFLASYFSEAFTNALVYAGSPPQFLAARREAGVWQAFPRDAAAVEIIQDGRWSLEPHPVDWVIMPAFAKALAVRRTPGTALAAILMGDSRECFAIFTPHETESHYSTYLSLFGRTIQPGEKATARVQLLLLGSPGEQAIVKAYSQFSSPPIR